MILDEIAARTRQRVEEEKAQISLDEMRARALAMEATTDFPFEAALRYPSSAR